MKNMLDDQDVYDDYDDDAITLDAHIPFINCVYRSIRTILYRPYQTTL